jgi:hypothetical protein
MILELWELKKFPYIKGGKIEILEKIKNKILDSLK